MAESDTKSPFITRSGLSTIRISPTEQVYGCTVCENICSSPIQLTIHYVVGHRLVPCVDCLSLFLNRTDLNEHIKEMHATANTDCSQCARTFPSKRELVDHLYDEHQKKYCRMCSALVRSCAVNTLGTHVQQVHKMPRQNDDGKLFAFNDLSSKDSHFDCLICRQQFPIERLFTHSLSFHKLSLGFIFANVLDKRHTSPLLTAIENVANASESKAFCATCRNKFTPLAPKIVHAIYCNGSKVCRWCYERFDDDAIFDAHVGSCAVIKDNAFDQCKFCDADVTRDRTHVWQAHRIDPAIYSEKSGSWNAASHASWIDSDYLCDFCGQNLSSVLQSVDGLIKHYVIHHKFSLKSILTFLKKSVVNHAIAANDKRRKVCFEEIDRMDDATSDGGGVIFDFDSKMVNVIYSSATDSDSDGADEQPKVPRLTRSAYVCIFCPFRTAVKHLLARHLGKKHGFTPKIEDHRCNACNKAFTTQLNLRRHFQNVHHKRNADYYNCPFCSFAIKGKQKMRRHIALHVESSYHPCLVKQIGFNCRHCHQSFWLIEKLNEHMFNRHTDKFERNFLMCSICASTFINKVSLRQHREIKHPTASVLTSFLYQCKICCTAHIDIDDIRTHMAEMHPTMRSSYCAAPRCRQYVSENEPLDDHLVESHRRRLFKCRECPKIFESKAFVMKHFEETHDDAKKLKQ